MMQSTLWIWTADKHIYVYVLLLLRRGNALETRNLIGMFGMLQHVTHVLGIAGDLVMVSDVAKNFR